MNEYASKLGKSVKKKIVNAWSRLTMLEGGVNSLSEKILKESLSSKSNEEKGSDKKDASERRKFLEDLPKGKEEFLDEYASRYEDEVREFNPGNYHL